jgi:lipoprotein-anchoring transpeptidase ErfK/SrfK
MIRKRGARFFEKIMLKQDRCKSMEADLTIETTNFPDDHHTERTRTGTAMGASGWMRRLRRRGFAWRHVLAGGAVVLSTCLTTVPASTQTRAQFTPTMEEPPPGVFHGNTSDHLGDEYQRQAVYYRSQHPVGTIVVETRERHLYLIESETRALRYGIGVGREGFTWSGLLQITQKQQWPDWHPPPEMIQRQPYLPRFMAGGPGNPLGARAMHLGNTVYRIHGTNAPETIGHAVSSGCFRLVNEDVIDLYDRVPVGTRVIVRQN